MKLIKLLILFTISIATLSYISYASAEELANAVKQQVNGKDKEIPIEQMTTTTKLNALYSNWKKEQDEIQIRFTNQEKSINEKGGQYGKKDW